MNTSRITLPSVAILSAAVLLTGCSSSSKDSAPTQGVSSNAGPNGSTTSSQSASHGSDSTPSWLTMKSIGVNKHGVQSLGLASDGTLSPPKGVIEYYNATPKPGSKGNSIIAAHVTYDGPDVFANLDDAKKGDEVEVGSKDGTVRTFKVTRTASIDKDTLRHDQTVWGASQGTNLILVSCDAKSGWENAQHHKNNLVVWTSEVKTTPAH